MGNYKILEGKIWHATTVLTSGILTNIIYNILSDTIYVLKESEGKIIFIQQSNGIIRSLFLIGIVFMIIWISISQLLPKILKFINRFRFKKIVKYNRKDLIIEFELKEKAVEKLSSLLFLENKDSINDKLHENVIIMKVKELATIIVDLHKLFLPPNTRLKQRVKAFFRNPEFSTIINITDGISIYEFTALILILKEMISKIESIEESLLFQKDIEEMKKMLQELMEVYN